MVYQLPVYQLVIIRAYHLLF